MIRPSKEVYQALTNLRVSHDFGAVLEWLREARKTARDGLEKSTEEVNFHRSQGESLCLKAILEANDEAPQQLNKIKSK